MSGGLDESWPERGVSEALAVVRAAAIGDLHYDVAFTIPAERGRLVEGRAVVRFTLAAPQAVVLDFDRPAGAVARVRIGGTDADVEAVNGHLILPAERMRAGVNEVVVAFSAGDEALNRRDDLLYTLFVPARAHLAFPCFDQPDLRGRYTLTLDVPAGWQAIANEREIGREETARGWRIRFAPTPPLPTYLFAFVAGALAVETVAGGGRTFRIVSRTSDADGVARNRGAIATLHAAAIDWLERYTAVPYPFGPFDIVIVPSFQFRGMEHPGAVLYDAAALLLPDSPTETQLLDRASLIAHETAHMWFGDLVTMRWFSDVWLKEVFANLLAAKIVEPAFPRVHHGLRFLLAHQPEAYRVDRTSGANPVRQPLDNLREAGQLYGPIVYQKSVVAMRQLEQTVGARAFRDAARAYLREHAFGSASWPDLQRILGARARRDLTRWSRAWIEERGRPEVRADVRLDSGGRLEAIRLTSHDPFGRGLVWPQTFSVAVGYAGEVRHLPVRMSGRRATVAGARGLPRPLYVLPGGELGYGLFLLDEESRSYLVSHVETIPDALARGSAWVTLWEHVMAGHLDAAAFLTTAMRALPRETEAQIAERVLAWAARAFWRRLLPVERDRHGPAFEACLREEMARAGAASRKAACFRTFCEIATSPEGLGWLDRLWSRDAVVPGLPLGEADELAIAMELAVRGAPRSGERLRAQLARTTHADRRAECAFMLPALDEDPRVREDAFERLRAIEHRRREPWAVQSLRYLNHPLRERHARRFLRPALDLLREVQRTGDIFFPARWIDAALWGHRSPEAAAIVRAFLDGDPDYPQRLRWIVLTAADDLLATRQPPDASVA